MILTVRCDSALNNTVNGGAALGLLSDIPVSTHIRVGPPPHMTGMRYSRNRDFTETSNRQKSKLPLFQTLEFFDFKKNLKSYKELTVTLMFLTKRKTK